MRIGKRLALAGALVAVALTVAILDPDSVVVRILGATAAMIGWIACRTPRLAIRVASDGLDSMQLMGTVRMAWEDVVAPADAQVYARA